MPKTCTIRISVKQLIAAVISAVVVLLVVAFVTCDTWLQPFQGEAAESDEVCVWEWAEEDIRFREPGQYGISARGAIAGTPATEPRIFHMEASGFSAWLYDETITQ